MPLYVSSHHIIPSFSVTERWHTHPSLPTSLFSFSPIPACALSICICSQTYSHTGTREITQIFLIKDRHQGLKVFIAHQLI